MLIFIREVINMAFKFANDIISEIKARGPVEVPAGSVSGEEFEKWLYGEDEVEMLFIINADMICSETIENEFFDYYGDTA